MHRLLVALLSLLLSALGLGALILVEMSPERMAIVAGFVGTMFGWATSSVTYYLGSSQGSATKDALVGRLAGLGR